MIEPVEFVLDVDTTRSTAGGESFRLRGIQGDELSHDDSDFEGNRAAAGKARLEQLLAENPTAKKVVTGRDDKWGRDVGYYETEDGRDLNEQLVREGYAAAFDFKDERSPYHGAEIEYKTALRNGTAKYVPDAGTYVSPLEDERPLSYKKEFSESMKRGIDQTQGLLGYGISALARSIGLDSLASYGDDVAKKNFEEAQQHAASVGSYKDINMDDGLLSGLDKTARYVMGVVGEEIPQIGFDLAAAAATGGFGVAATAVIKKGLIEGAASSAFKKYGKAGLLGSMSAQQIGEVEAELRENGIDSPHTAIVGGLLGGLLDYTGAKVLLKTAGNLAKKGKLLQAKEVIAQGLKTTGLEGTTEALQEMTAKGAVLYHKSDFDMFSDDNIEAYVNAFLGGAIIGSAPSAAAGGASLIRKGFNKLAPNEIEKQNQETIGAAKTSSEVVAQAEAEGVNPVAVTTTARDAAGNDVQLGRELTMPQDAEVAKTKFEERAAAAGFTNIATAVESPKTVVDAREEAGEESVDSGDRVTEPFVEVEAQFRAMQGGGKDSVLTEMGNVLALGEKYPKEFANENLKVITDQNQDVVIVNTPEQEQAELESRANSQPESHPASDFSDGARERAKQFGTGEKAAPFEDSLDDIDNQELRKQQGAQEDAAIGDSLQQEADDANLATAPNTVDEEPSDKDAKQVSIEEATTEVDRKLKDVDSLEADVDKVEAVASHDTLDKNVQKNKIIVKGIAKFADDNNVDAAELAKGLKASIARGTIKGNDAIAMNAVLDEYDIEAKAKADPSKNSAFAEALADSEISSKVDTKEFQSSVEEDATSGFDIKQDTKQTISKFWQDAAVTNPAIEDPENAIFYEALETGISAANAILRKSAIRNAKDSEFSSFGFSSKEDLGRAKGLARKSSVWGGKAGEDVSKAMVLFRQGETVYSMYLPSAMVALNKSAWRFNTTVNERNFDARMQDQMAELFGFMADNDYRLFRFPSAKDNEVHIAFRPTVRGGKSPLTMVELTQNALRNVTQNKSDFSTPEFFTASQAQERLDAGIKLDKAIDRAIFSLQKKQPIKEQAFSASYANFLADKYETLVDKQQDALEEFESQLAQDIEAGRVAPQAIDSTRTAPAPAPATGSRDALKRKLPTPKISDAKPVTFVEGVREYISDLIEEISPKSGVTVKFDPSLTQVATVDIEDGVATIRLNKDKLEALNAESPEAVKFVLAHEVGHVFVAETMHNIPDDVLAGLHRAFSKARARKPSGHPYKKRLGVGFDEWLSDQFAVHIQNSEQKGNTFFDRLIRMVKKIADSLSPMFGVDRVSASDSGQAFMQSMFKAGVKGKTPTDSEFSDSLASLNSEFGGNRPQTFAQERRYSVEQRALGRKIDPNKTVKANRDFTLGQNLNKTSDLGRAAINGFGTAMTKTAKAVRSMLTDPSYIPSKAAKFYDFARKGAPMFFTSANELKGMRGGRNIANKFRAMFDKATADSALWQNEAQASFNAASASELESFIKGTGAIPKPIAEFLSRFHKKLKRDMPTLGTVSDFFPRAYDIRAIEGNREAFEKLMVKEALKKGIPNFGEKAATNATDSILQDRGAFSGVTDDVAPVFGNDPLSSKTRVLEFMDDAVLRQEGFLRSDINDVILGYTHRMARRANFEHEFSGWSPLISRDDDAGTQARGVTFTSKLFMTLPFKWDNGRPMSAQEKFDMFKNPDEFFFQEHKKFFKQAVREGYLREQGKGEGKYWEYYDKNKVLRETYNTLTDPSDKQRYIKIVDAMEGRTGADDLSPKARDAMSTAVAYQNWLTLMFSGFSQLIEVSGVVFRNRDIEGAIDSLKEIGSLVMGQNASERRALFNDLGFAQKQLTQQALLESMGINYQSATAQKMNNVLFKVNGMNYVTNASRILGASVAERFIQRNAKKAAKGNPRSERYLSELGLTLEDANYANSDTYRPYSDFVRQGDVSSPEALKAEAIHKAMFKFVDSAIVRPNASQRPVWGSDPRWMLIWHLKSFMYAYGSSVLGGLNSEIQSRYAETRKSSGSTAKAIGDASIPFMVYAIPVLLMSGLALELREFIQYTALGLGSKPYSDSLYGSDYMMELVSRGGMMGPLEMGYSIGDDVIANNRSSLMGWISPTTSHLETILSWDAARIVNRSVPIVAQNPAMKDWFRELFN